MPKRERTKGQTMICQIMHKKLKIEQLDPTEMAAHKITSAKGHPTNKIETAKRQIHL